MSTDSESDSEDEFVRCRLILTSDIDDKLDELAATETGGNRSALVRKAVLEKHRRGDMNLLQHELQRVTQQLEALTEVIEELPSQPLPVESRNRKDEFDPIGLVPGSGKHTNNEQEAVPPSKVARELRPIIPAADNEPIPLRELLRKLDYPHSSVMDAIAILRDRDVIEQLDRGDALEYCSIQD